MNNQNELLSSLLFLVIVLIMATTNPSKDEFVEHVKNEYVESSSNDFELAFSKLTKGIAGLSAKSATRKNYVVFSTYQYNGRFYFGVFGNFFSKG